MMRRLIAALLALLALAMGGAALAQPAFPDRGTAPVLDLANIIDPATEASLTQRLDAFEQTNQRQFVVVTLPSLDGLEISDYGYQLGRHWGLGDKDRNDGIILIVAPNERKVRIEVGYGLEGVMPDGLAFDIVEATILPRFREGNMALGISEGADAIIRQLQLPPEEAAAVAAAAAEDSEAGFPVGLLIWIGFVVLFFVLPAIFGRGRRYRRGGAGDAVRDIILWEAGKAITRGMTGGGSNWGGGGSWGGGGGFSGGGGSFGGGGASGSW